MYKKHFALNLVVVTLMSRKNSNTGKYVVFATNIRSKVCAGYHYAIAIALDIVCLIVVWSRQTLLWWIFMCQWINRSAQWWQFMLRIRIMCGCHRNLQHSIVRGYNNTVLMVTFLLKCCDTWWWCNLSIWHSLIFGSCLVQARIDW